MSKDLKPSTVQQLHIYFLRPKLEYVCPVWHGALLERDALVLERVQGAVARSILRAPFQASKSVMFEQLNWPSLRWRREILCITLFHLILHTRPPPGPLIPACFHLHRRTPSGLPANQSNWFFFESAPADMLSHSSSVQHSSGTLSLHTCKTSLVTVNSRRTLKHTCQHTSTEPSFAFCHEVFHDEPCPMPNYNNYTPSTFYNSFLCRFSSLPSTSFSSSSSSHFFRKFCVGIVVCHFR